MTIGIYDFRTPVHPTVAAEFRIIKFGNGFYYERKNPNLDDNDSASGFPTQEACEKAALRYLRSLPPRRDRAPKFH